MINHGLAGKCPLTPEVYGDGNSYAYAGRRESCPISHTDWGNAPMNFRLTSTKEHSGEPSCSSLRRPVISSLLKAPLKCPLRDMGQTSRLGYRLLCGDVRFHGQLRNAEQNVIENSRII